MTAPIRFGDQVHVHAETRLIRVTVARGFLHPGPHIVAVNNHDDHDDTGEIGLPYNPADGWPGQPLPHTADLTPALEGDHLALRRFPCDPHPGVIIGERHPTDPAWGTVPLYQVALEGDDAAVVVLVYPDDLTDAA